VVSPSENTNGNAFHPNGLPPQCNAPSTFTDFQKLTKMKNAMLNATEIPLLSMWKDESVVFPNLAARRLLQVDADPTSDDSYDFKSRFNPWSADFSRQLGEGDNPIIALCRTQKPFTRWQIGMKNEKTGKKLNFDVSGHPVFDEKTNEFLAGMIAFKDVTEYTEQIASKSAENEEQFRLICNTMPQMCWTTSPDGYHDYFSQRWYDYTGLTPANSLGLGWKLPFHDEDMPEAGARWAHSLATGDEYKTQYRCRRYDGEWRWMLGRALPLRDHNTGQILRWFGTCTDIQEIIDAKESGQRARKSLMDVLQHSQMTLWMVDRDTNVTFFEGSFPNEAQISKTVIGTPVTEVLSRFLNNESIRGISRAVARTLQGESDMEIIEHKVDGRWIRTKLVPLKGKQGPNGVVDEAYIAGVIGIGTEVTQLRQKEQENIKLLANETAAKEASKMKSNFLANMSHEIRTPIAGVLGMSELLMDTILDPEQTEFAQNIQRSANSLLTVINDILDFSKIESGRLDIEEVQFSLGVVLEDVAKMLSFAAQRKGLDFSNDVHFGLTEDIILLGDPGRIRQILTNLLTNSIKFTSDGYVKLSTKIIEDTNDTATVEFMVEDTGIGIEEEVKKRLFRPFSQADSSTARRFGGTGLGLTICKNLVDLMHGSIRLDSKLDSGTKAIFAIPFKKPEFRSGGNTTFLEVGSMPDRLQSELSLSQSRSSKDDHRKSHRISPPLNSASLFHSKFGAFAPTSVDAAAEVEIQRDQYHVLVVEGMNPLSQLIPRLTIC
jgi:PAS domain S-box-containing protein